MSKYLKFRKDNNLSLKDDIGNLYKYVPEKALVLDVGCSTGYFGEILIKEKKAICDGIEINKLDAAKAKKVLHEVFSFDLESEVWPDRLLSNKYDIIFFGDILEHLKQPGEILKRFRKLLKTKGVVIISIPNIAHASIRLDLLLGNFDYEDMGILDNTHLKYFTFKSFTNLLTSSGYEIVDFDQATVPMPEDSVDLILEKLGLKASEQFYELMNLPDATAYQYKIVAKPGKSKKLPKLPTKPLEIAKRQTIKTEQLYKQIHDLNIELINKDKELSHLKNSASWKITKPLRKVRSKFGGN